LIKLFSTVLSTLKNKGLTAPGEGGDPAYNPQIARFLHAERDLGVPIRFIYLFVVYNFLFFPLSDIPRTEDLHFEVYDLAKMIFLIYGVMNLFYLTVLVTFRNLTYRRLLYAGFIMSMLDALMFCCIIVIEDGFESSLYWVYFGMMLRNAYAVSDAFFQISLNLTIVFLYVIAGLLSETILEYNEASGSWILAESVPNYDIVYLRLALLGGMVIFCFGIQVLFDKERKLIVEQTELRVRNEHLKGVSRLGAEIAHQLKNPLSIINNAAYILEKNQSNPELIKSQASVIRQEISRSDLILRDLMSDANQSSTSVRKLSIKDEVSDAIHRAIPEKIFPNIKVAFENCDEELFLMIQKKHLSEILVNLLVNAREAIGDEGLIKVKISRHSESEIMIQISDSGQGIDPKIQTQVFEAYFSTKDKGTGLGLCIVKKYVEFYSGHIYLNSSENGTTFNLVFPENFSAVGSY